ncbi:MAG: ATP-dependent RNA helicase HrpA [Burkholderiaceae bacterium]|nr:ATP-dependent RNA helicase HrpA [Burkholderiaceae bacterium]
MPASKPVRSVDVPPPPRSLKITFPENLPVSARRGEIEALLAAHQVVIVCGETGSGKTTQLPKIALAMGRGRINARPGVKGKLIGHTQPRRIAATSVARRIAEELNTPPGEVVGYQVRFQDRLAPGASVKLMTDGILLAETQSDPLLLAYDTLIIDEAHERSLNIDFLLGYLKQILPRRPDLKVIVTSATIDADRFARHFASRGSPVPGRPEPGAAPFWGSGPHEVGERGGLIPAPVIQVSGRLYPVEQRWRPFEESRDYGFNDAIADAVDELWRGGAVQAESGGDILVFLPGEREIHEAADHLRAHLARSPVLREAQVLPLFARLSQAEQERVFEPHGHRRIVLATNVAETSLTVPGIRYVIDTGTARVKRYSYRSKVEQLQIEPVSQAAANQRAGRCGRVADGICIRLYDERDFAGRPRFTDPEILRSSLASVILRMKSLHLGGAGGRVEDFPFLDAPSGRAIADGYQLLAELGAVDDAGELTPLGGELARLPLDPRVGRMLIEARQRGAVDEVLVIAAALSVQDVRDRPLEQQAQADQAHAKFDDDKSEFSGYLKLWQWLHGARGGHSAKPVHSPSPTRGREAGERAGRSPGEARAVHPLSLALSPKGERETEGAAVHKLSNRQYEQLLRQNFISVRRVREWRDIYAQLRAVAGEQHWQTRLGSTQEPARVARASGLSPSSASGGGLGWGGAQRGRSRKVLQQAPQAPIPTFPRTRGKEQEEQGCATGSVAQTGGSAALHQFPPQAGEGGNSYEALHKSLLAGLLGNVGCKIEAEAGDKSAEYLGARGIKFYRHPGAHLSKRPGRWIVCAELVETTRLFGRGIAAIEPQWLEEVAGHLLKKQVLDPHWEKKAGEVIALERATLYGLPVYTGRRVRYALADPSGARELMLREALVADDWPDDWARALPFLPANRKLIAQVEAIEHKSRRQDVLVDDELIYAFYDRQIPEHVADGRQLQAWYRDAARANPKLLHLTREELMRHEAAGITTAAFPSVVRLGGVDCAAAYLHEPGDAHDGLTVTVPLFALNQVSEERAEWLAPGMLKEKIQALLKSLPQKPRSRFVPLPESAVRLAQELSAPEAFGRGSLTDALLARARAETGLDVKRADFKLDMLPAHLFMALRVVDEHGRQLGAGRNLAALKAELGGQARGAFQALAALKSAAPPVPAAVHKSDQKTAIAYIKSELSASKKEANMPEDARYTGWTFGELPELLELRRKGQTLIGFPALVDDGDAVRIEVFDEPDAAAARHRAGLGRLCALQIRDALKYLEKNIPDLQKMAAAYMPLGTAEELRGQIVDLAVDRAFLQDPLPQNAAAFAERVRQGRTRLTLIAQEVARLAHAILAEYAAAQRKLKDAKGHPEAVQDAREQVQRLIGKRFLSDTPWPALQHFPRYLKAVQLRIDKLRADPTRDAGHMQNARAQEQRYWRLVADRKGQQDARMQDLRWLLEELRVSLFAQELRTPQPVSLKRLEKVWGQVMQ